MSEERLEGDGRYVDPERLTSDGHLLDDRSEPCPKCGYIRLPMPDWVWLRVVFILDGKHWVVSSMGSTNYCSSRSHFRDSVCAQAIESEAQVFAPKIEVLRRQCFVEDMQRATFVKLLPGGPKRAR